MHPYLGLSTLILPNIMIYHFGPDLALFIYIFQYLALFTIDIYSHLALLNPYLVIFTLNCPTLTIYAIFNLHRYSSETAPP